METVSTFPIGVVVVTVYCRDGSEHREDWATFRNPEFPRRGRR